MLGFQNFEGFRNFFKYNYLECLVVVMFVYYLLRAHEIWFVHCLLNCILSFKFFFKSMNKS